MTDKEFNKIVVHENLIDEILNGYIPSAQDGGNMNLQCDCDCTPSHPGSIRIPMRSVPRMSSVPRISPNWPYTTPVISPVIPVMRYTSDGAVDRADDKQAGGDNYYKKYLKYKNKYLAYKKKLNK